MLTVLYENNKLNKKVAFTVYKLANYSLNLCPQGEAQALHKRDGKDALK